VEAFREQIKQSTAHSDTSTYRKGKVLRRNLMLKKVSVLLILIVFALTGCEVLEPSLPETCEELAPQIVTLSEEQTSPFAINILKLYEIKEVTKTNTRIECTADANAGSGDGIAIEFQAYSDQDGDVFIGYNAAD